MKRKTRFYPSNLTLEQSVAFHERARALFHATQEHLPLEDRRNFSQATMAEKLHYQALAKKELGL